MAFPACLFPPPPGPPFFVHPRSGLYLPSGELIVALTHIHVSAVTRIRTHSHIPDQWLCTHADIDDELADRHTAAPLHATQDAHRPAKKCCAYRIPVCLSCAKGMNARLCLIHRVYCLHKPYQCQGPVGDSSGQHSNARQRLCHACPSRYAHSLTVRLIDMNYVAYPPLSVNTRTFCSKTAGCEPGGRPARDAVSSAYAHLRSGKWYVTTCSHVYARMCMCM